MSMQVNTPGAVTRCGAITDIIESIALEQNALGHILCAEGEKMQRILSLREVCPQQLLKVNRSIEHMVNSVARLEVILHAKLDLFRDCLCECEEDEYNG